MTVVLVVVGALRQSPKIVKWTGRLGQEEMIPTRALLRLAGILRRVLET